LKRPLLIQIHLVLASVFMPLMLMMPLTGTSYLLGFKGTEVKTEAFRTSENVPEDKNTHRTFFEEQFKKQNLDFGFEQIKESGSDFIFRPSSRVHYMASKSAEGGLIFTKIEPNLLKRLIEIHKGHGPQLMRYFEMAFGFALILTTLSGLWLAFTVPAYTKSTLISFGVGALVIVLCLI
jgi:hypothetical protein